jgi:hypothetical protein
VLNKNGNFVFLNNFMFISLLSHPQIPSFPCLSPHKKTPKHVTTRLFKGRQQIPIEELRNN